MDERERPGVYKGINAMTEERKALTVIMPALNEEANIARAIDNTLRALADYNINGEIIIINDGSRDRTPEVVKDKMAGHAGRIVLINHEAPKGIGASFWEGVDAAIGETVVMLPGDNENDPWEILRYFGLLREVDMVIPFIFNREARPFFRNALSLLYRFIINTTFLVNFNYTNGTILYRRSLLKELRHRSSGFFFQTDILVRTAKRGYLFAEVPYKIGLRKEGVSKAVTFPSLMQVVRGYLRLVKDYYFGKEEDLSFSEDSLTLMRRQA